MGFHSSLQLFLTCLGNWKLLYIFLQKCRHMTDLPSTRRAGEFSAEGIIPLGFCAYSAALARVWI